MFDTIGEGHKIMTEGQKPETDLDAEELVRVCHAITSQGECPARDNPTLLCPIGDDGICENVTVADWIFILMRMKDARI